MQYFAQIPKVIVDQEVLGEENAAGLRKWAQVLGITDVTEAQMLSLTDALVQSDTLYNASRSAQQTAYDLFRPANDALTAWLGKANSAFGAFFGKRWNKQWVQAGYVNSSYEIPATIADRLGLALRIISFLSGNPDKEVPTLGVTAANGTTQRNNAINMQNAVTAADQDVDNKGTVRQTASDALTSKMRILMGMLAELLPPDDTRWLDFGFVIPGKVVTPGAPTGLAVATSPTAAANGSDTNTSTVLITWDGTPFATRYRVRMRIAELLGSKYELVASVTEPMAQVDVPANAAVEFIIQAVNGNRQSVASDAIIYQPVVDAPVVAPAQVGAPVAIIAPANGTHGLANGSRVAVRK